MEGLQRIAHREQRTKRRVGGCRVGERIRDVLVERAEIGPRGVRALCNAPARGPAPRGRVPRRAKHRRYFAETVPEIVTVPPQLMLMGAHAYKPTTPLVLGIHGAAENCTMHAALPLPVPSRPQ